MKVVIFAQKLRYLMQWFWFQSGWCIKIIKAVYQSYDILMALVVAIVLSRGREEGRARAQCHKF